jgi:sulfate transport system ATP-binding protein
VANRVVVMNEGRIEQIGTPDEVYDRPANPFVYNFLGSVNLFHGRVREGQVHLGDTVFPLPDPGTVRDAPAVAYVRPHEITVLNHPNSSACLPAMVRHVNSAGPLVHVELERTDDGSHFAVELTREQSRAVQLQAGTQVFVELRNLRVFSEDYSI